MPLKQFIPNPVLLASQKDGEMVRWLASHQHYELEKLRLSNPERYRMVYPSVLRLLQQRQSDLIHV